MKLKDIKVNSLDTLGKYISKYRIIFIIILSLVATAEIALAIGGVMSYDFSKLDNVLYLIFFILLAFFSLSLVVILIIDKIKGVKPKTLAILCHSYGVFFLIWGAVVSFVDVKNNYYPVEFLSVLIVVSAIIMINPVAFTITSSIGLATLVLLDLFIGKKFLNISDYFNIAIFFLVSVFISFRQHYTLVTDEKTKKYLNKISLEDQVTGFGNEAAFVAEIDVIDNEIESRKRKFSVFIIEVNQIEDISDVYGYKYAFNMINTIGHLLNQLFNDSKIYRIQGNQFVIISKQNDYDRLEEVKGTIEKTLNSAVVSYEETELKISLSYGVSKFKIGDSFNEVFKRAQKANQEMKTKTN